MIIWAFLVCLLVDFAVAGPVQGRDNNDKFGYEYGVKHPGGSSRVRVRSGGDQHRNYYPKKDSNFPNADYFSDASYINPHYVGPAYQPDRHGHYQRSYPQEPSYSRIGEKVPVYEERFYSKPAGFRQVPSHGQFSNYGHGSYEPRPDKHVISQSAVDAGPLYEKPADKLPVNAFYPKHSSPQIVQQEFIDEPLPKYPPGKYEQLPLEPEPLVIEQIPSDDYSKPSSYPSDTAPGYSKHEQSPIDQQILVDEPKETPVLLQKPLEEKPVLSQVIEDYPSTKNVPIVPEAPTVQQSSLDIAPPSSIVNYMDDDEVSQINVDDEPAFDNKPPIVQQVSDGDSHFIPEQSPLDYAGKNFGSPVSQRAVDDHPSQAVYDSSIEPSFSDSDRHTPPYLYGAQPRYRFVPNGPPYQRISHSTEIIHGPPRSYYSRGPPSQKYINTDYPVFKGPAVHHSAKYPPPPPVTKSVIPVHLPPTQEHVDGDIVLVKNPPVSQSIKIPSHAPEALSQAQEHVDADIFLPKNIPEPQTVKLPPPAPGTKTVLPAQLPHQQEHVDSDIVLANNPPVLQSVKLPPPPPPPPTTKTVIPAQLPYQQEDVNSDIVLANHPPVLQSVKLPPPPPITKTVIPDAQEHLDADIILTKNPPVPSSVKLPPPVPITKTVIPDAQKHVDEDIILIKDPQSIKLPPPAQEYVDTDIVLTKNPPVPQSVKLPLPPVTKSVVPVKLPPPPVTKSAVPIKLPPPPVTKSVVPVKLPPPPVTKSAVPVKLPPPPVTKSVASGLLSHDQKPVVYDDEPFYGHKSTGSSLGKLPSVASHFSEPHYTDPQPPYSVKHPYSASPILPKPYPNYGDPQLHSDIPLTKTAPISHSVKHPVVSNVHSVKHPKSIVASGSPHVKIPQGSQYPSPPSYANGPENYPSSYSVKQQPHPAFQDYDSNSENQHLKYPPHDGPPKKYSPISHGPKNSYFADEEGLNYNNPPESVHFDEPVEEKSPFDKYPPVSHSIRLPTPVLKPTSAVSDDKISVADIGESSPLDKYPPVSHSIRLPISPKTTAVPNLFAAVPSLPTDAHSDADDESKDSEHSIPKSEALISPVSHSVRLTLPIQGNRYSSVESADEPKQAFPAFPVESAFRQRDPVSEKVAADLSNVPGAGFVNPNHEPEENESNSPSVDEAKEEIDRVNKEIGISFGDRLRRSRYSRFS